MLYDLDFIQNLPEPEEGWKAPLVAYVAKSSTDKHASFKEFLEKCFNNIPDDQKPNYYSRLRSLDDKIFIAQANEFLVAEMCSMHGEVDFNPTLTNGQTPELLWTINESIGLLDVVTIFESEDTGQEGEEVDRLLNYLSDVEHFFDVGLWYQNIDRTSLKPSSIKKRLIQYLDNIDPDNIDPEEELIIEEDGFYGGFFISPKRDNTNKSKINFALLGPAQDVEPVKAIEKRIKSKLRKYKWDGPIFVAVCKAADFGVDWEEVAEVLYGPSVIHYNSKTREHEEVLGRGGLIMPKGSNPPLNSSLTGILHCEQNWNAELPTLTVKYLVNPFAKYPIQLPLPTYPNVENSLVRFEWKNRTKNDKGHH
ncbi:hypothetical protein [Paenibacillus sp. YAF4_2]|uniref:hypothetical protein n=1 Tax=Paenibacillus sp. YAF4_2 TaxID=3233085 RepID=UPI003F9B2716